MRPKSGTSSIPFGRAGGLEELVVIASTLVSLVGRGDVDVVGWPIAGLTGVETMELEVTAIWLTAAVEFWLFAWLEVLLELVIAAELVEFC